MWVYIALLVPQLVVPLVVGTTTIGYKSYREGRANKTFRGFIRVEKSLVCNFVKYGSS